MLAELTHRCPLQCPYCSNPVELDRGGTELTTDEWKKVLTELAEIGVLQIHFCGGEPTARKDIVEILQKPQGVTERWVELHRLEHKGDDVYHRAVGALFHETRDALTVIKWKDIYEKLEAAIDRCENVANIIEGVIIKHS
jgi:uncharacterized radical SAM superfamily Fe-S cluster-containing enzyme